MYNYNIHRGSINTGDIILFSGKGRISNIIKWVSKSKWSHVGVAIKIKEFDMILCLESTTLVDIPDYETGATVGYSGITNFADFRVLTASSANATTAIAQSNLIFDGTKLGLATTAPRAGVLSNAINTLPALDISGQIYARLPVYIQSTTSVDLNTNYNTLANCYFYITNSGFNAITLPSSTPTSQGGTFFQFKNSTSSSLSITLTNTLGLSSPVAISPSNAITFVVSPSDANTMLLF
jgi:hypothetical protein